MSKLGLSQGYKNDRFLTILELTKLSFTQPNDDELQQLLFCQHQGKHCQLSVASPILIVSKKVVFMRIYLWYMFWKLDWWVWKEIMTDLMYGGSVICRVPRWLLRPVRNTAGVDPDLNRKSHCSKTTCLGSLVMVSFPGLMTRESPLKFPGL